MDQKTAFDWLDEQMPNADDAELTEMMADEFGIDLGEALGFVEAYREAVENE